MLYTASSTAIGVFLFFTLGVLVLSFYLGRKTKSARGYFAAHGQVPWLVNGVAFAGDYLSAASFLGICGLIAFYGYDGFLYSIGYLAGWVVALFVIAEPIRRLGKYTFADALDAAFGSRAIRLTAAISTLVVSIFYLIPQMVGAGALVRPLLGLEHWQGVAIVGFVVVTIVVTAGMVSTTWVQFIKGALLVVCCAVLALLVLQRGVATKAGGEFPRILPNDVFEREVYAAFPPGTVRLDRTGPWENLPFVRYRLPDGRLSVWQVIGQAGAQLHWPSVFIECQVVTELPGGGRLVNGRPQSAENDVRPMGHVLETPRYAQDPTGPGSTGRLGPVQFVRVLTDATMAVPAQAAFMEDEGRTVVHYPKRISGEELMTPGVHPTLFAGVKSEKPADQLNFISLMLALFCGTASLPHVLIRYYTVRDTGAALKSTVVGIMAIGFFYVLTMYLGLGAMISGRLDVTDSNMAAPLLARSFGEMPFAVISAVAFTTILGTVSGLILAASGAVAHDIISNVLGHDLGDAAKVKAGKVTAIVVGGVAIALGIVFRDFNVGYLVGWAFSVAASANLPALIMVLFWRDVTRQGVATGIVVGMVSSLTWILLSSEAYVNIYGLPAEPALAPFTQPGLVTIPLGFVVIFAVSLMTARRPGVGLSGPRL